LVVDPQTAKPSSIAFVGAMAAVSAPAGHALPPATAALADHMAILVRPHVSAA
jgi:hypothetical protein